MKVDIAPGKYVVAVSGGVDSMVLLHLLVQKVIVNSQQSTVNSQRPKSKKDASDYRLGTTDSMSSIELIVAHFNHGIRPDSVKDEQFVADTAKRYGLKFVAGRATLGVGASEAKARAARYDFLQKVKKANNADYIVTAHHQDDLIETAILNILRGTGRRGITAIADNVHIKRPLLNIPKAEIIKYAKDNKLSWREDSTNKQDIYLRNYLRKHILPKLSSAQREKLLKNVEDITKINKESNKIIATLSQNIAADDLINRQKFSMLPREVADELVVYWLRQQGAGYDRKLVEKLSLSIKTAKPGTSQNVSKKVKLVVGPNIAQFKASISPRLI